MKVIGVVLVWVCFASAFAQNATEVTKSAEPPTAQVQRKGILEFEFDPEDGAFVFRAVDSQGRNPLPLTALKVDAINGTNTIRLELTSPKNGVARGKTPLAQEEWELLARAELPDGVLQGQYRLGVGQAPSSGRFALVPPNPEVNRLSWLIGLLIGTPVALGVIVTLVVAVARVLKPKSSSPSL